MANNQDDIEGLQKLVGDIETFTGNIFDWVGFLGRVDFLHAVYEFKTNAETKLKQLEATNA